ncbi:MAG TPA: hypothetical protein VIV60_29190, partial [Polyangiaceae bacterium]
MRMRQGTPGVYTQEFKGRRFRKTEKRLREAEALLDLQKKVHALWGDANDDTPNVKDRERSRPATLTKPRHFIANAPLQVLTWDITYLRHAHIRGQYFYL